MFPDRTHEGKKRSNTRFGEANCKAREALEDILKKGVYLSEKKLVGYGGAAVLVSQKTQKLALIGLQLKVVIKECMTM